jgi:hypothetical protein
VDEDEQLLVLASLRTAIASATDDLAAVLTDFGWAELAEADEAFAVITLFEELGRGVLDTNALDLVTATLMGLDADLTVLWPISAATNGSFEWVPPTFEGVTLRSVASRSLFVPGPDGLHQLGVSSLTETTLGGMAEGTAWMRVQAEGIPEPGVGDWGVIERRGRLALASELIGVAERTIDVAAEHVSAREQFGQPIGAYQAVRFRLAEAYAEMVGARALVAGAWEDGSSASARLAQAAACVAADVVAKHALQVCGAIGFSAEHPLPGLVRRAVALAGVLPPSSARQIGASLEPVPNPVASY